jgi:hypothetical protein
MSAAPATKPGTGSALSWSRFQIRKNAHNASTNATPARIKNNHHNQETRIDAIRKGRTMTAVRSLFIRGPC